MQNHLPEHSFGKAFSQLGRLENAWAAALAKPDPIESVIALRKLYKQFSAVGQPAWPMWLAFQQTVLDPRFAGVLGVADFEGLRDVGEQFASAGAFGIGQAWWPLVSCLVARGTLDDLQAAHSLLIRFYHSPLAFGEDRIRAAASLAGIGAVDDQALAVYAEVVAGHPGTPPEIVTMVDAVLAVGFEADDARLGRAYTLAQWLGAAGPVSAAAYALGMGELLLYRRPQAALGHFRRVSADSGLVPGELQRAELSAYLYLRDYNAALSIDRRTLNTRGIELLALCRMLGWLDGPAVGSAYPASDGDAAPETSAGLTAIAPGRDVGAWRDYAVGRACLLEGDAAAARRWLAPLVGAGFVAPDVCYHTAWAHVLCQDPDGVKAVYRAVAGRPGEWAISCLVLDSDPEAGPQLQAEPVAHEALRATVLARRELADGRALGAPAGWEVPELAGTLQCERLETLRTALGVVFISDHFYELELLTRTGLFARLPVAEQLLWNALVLHASNPERCRELLERSRACGRNRAALLLAADALKAGRAADVGELLHDVSGPKAQLLTAWADAQNGARTRAAARLQPLSAQGLPQAHYAVGLLALGDAAANWAAGLSDQARRFAQQAARAFESVGARGFHAAAMDRLARAAHALTDPAGVRPLPWRDLAEQPWTARLLALAQLVGVSEATDPLLVQAFSGAESSASAPVLAGALLRSGVLTRDTSASEATAQTLAALAQRDPSPANRRAARCAAANAALRLRGEFPDAVDDPLLATVGAGVVLADGDRGKAVHRLRALTTGDADQSDRQSVGAMVVAAFADAVDGNPGDPLPEGVPAVVAGAFEVARAAARAASGDPQATVDCLLRVLRNEDVKALIDVDAVLPFLSLHATEPAQQTAVAELVQQAADSEAGAGGLSAAELARCAALVGDLDTAEGLWGRALSESAGDSEQHARLSEEYGLFLCHRAVVADVRGDRKAALSNLRRAEIHSPGMVGTVLADLSSDALVSALLDHLFPGSPMLAWQRAGRYPVLAEAIETSIELRQALDADQHDEVIDKWVEYTADHGDVPELWHTVALLCREDALARPEGDAGAAAALTVAAALFALPAERAFSGLDGVAGELLAEHKVRLTRALAVDDIEAARAHVRCLAGVGRGVRGVRELLADGAFRAIAERYDNENHNDIDGTGPAARQANELLDQWSAERLEAAELLLSDNAALAKLPPGIDRDYPSAIRELEVMVTLGVVPKSVLVTAVEWHNQWLRCLYHMGAVGQMKPVADSSTRFADRLASVCTPDRPHLKENQELGEYFVYMGFHLLPSSPERAIGYFETARSWDPNNASATGLIKSAQRRIENQILDNGKACLDRGDFDTAERLLRGSVEGRELLIVAFVTKALNLNTAGLRLLTAQEARQKGLSTADQRAVFLATNAESVRLLIRAQRIDPGHNLVLEHLEDVRNLPARMRIT